MFGFKWWRRRKLRKRLRKIREVRDMSKWIAGMRNLPPDPLLEPTNPFLLLLEKAKHED